MKRTQSSQPQQLLQFRTIKSNHRLTIDDGDRGRPEAHLDQLVSRARVSTDILGNELHTLARKKLFLLFATASPRLRVHNHLLGHSLLRDKTLWLFRPLCPYLPTIATRYYEMPQDSTMRRTGITHKNTIGDWGDPVNGPAA